MRKLMWFTVGFAVACAVCAYFLAGSLIYILAAVCTVAAMMMLIGEPLFGYQKIIGLVLAGVAIGGFWCQYNRDLSSDQATLLDGKVCTVTVVASDYGYDIDFGTAVEGKVNLEGRYYKVRLYLNHDRVIRPGDKITGEFHVDSCDSQWDADHSYFSAEGICYLLFGGESLEVISPEKPDWYYFPAIWRKQISDRIEELFSGDTLGFAKALMLGDTSSLSYRTDTDLKQSGLRHVAAVSGLHVSILYGFVFALLGKRRRITSLMMIPILVLFAMVSGFSASVVRACVMHLLMQLAYLFKREPDDRTSLSAAVLLLLVINPQSIMSVGLQLSVASVAGMLAFSRGISEWIKHRKLWGNVKKGSFKRKLVYRFAESVAVSLSASAFTLPLTAVHFGSMSLMGVVSNLLCLWVINFIFCGIAVSCAMASIWLLPGKLLAAGVSWLIRYILWIAGKLGAFPLASVYTASPYIVAWMLVAAFLLILFGSNRILKLRYTAIMICISLLLALGTSWIEPYIGAFRVTVFDVGQGQSVLIQTEGKNYLVDCGGDDDRSTADSVSNYLASRGVFRLDGIILTHYDRDHVGAVPYLLQRMRVDTLYLPSEKDDEFETKILSRHLGEVHRVDDDLSIEVGGGVIQIFAASERELGNESSLCILFQKADYDILITGDRGETGELALLLEETLPFPEVLVAGHHGASGSTSEMLLKTLRPQLVIISVGADNPYGHPSRQVLERLKEFGCEIRRTDLDGTIVLVG